MGRLRRQSRGTWGLALSLGLALWACGGRSERELSTNSHAGTGTTEGGGQGGSPGSGGSNATGAASAGEGLSAGGTATAGTATASVGGTVSTGAAASRGGASTGATTGTSGRGAIGGTGAGGAVSNGGDGGEGCFYAGSYHARGSTYPAGDGCSTCTCTPAGSDCSTSTSTCPGGACSMLASEYADAFDRARSCVSGRAGECTGLWSASLRCPCPTAVNDTPELEALYSAWHSANCDQTAPLSCPACIPLDTFGTIGYCAADGRCARADVTLGGAGYGGDAGAAGQ